MFMQDSSEKFRNLRLIVDFLSYISLCANSDKTYLYSSFLCESKTMKSYFVLNALGFSKSMILDRELFETLDTDSDMVKSQIDVLVYENKIKNVALEKNISMLKSLKLGFYYINFA
ncbi:MAG: hypothetical protein RBR65_00510 [Aliarcobacter sp.]|jgi:hypothetical protein|nr:hypothetical protein [Aliarcobacter sp.]